MAPEVYKGNEYGSCVDIYSLGIVMYRLLNGNRTPFLPLYPNKITFSDKEEALARRMSGERIPPPTGAEGRIAEIVLKACDFHPQDRYSSPMQMRAELESIMYAAAESKVIYPQGDTITLNDLSSRTGRTGRTGTSSRSYASSRSERTGRTVAAPAKYKKFYWYALIAAPVLVMAVVLFFVLRPSRNDIDVREGFAYNNGLSSYPEIPDEPEPPIENENENAIEVEDYQPSIVARFVLYSDFYIINGEEIQEEATPFIHLEMGTTMIPLRIYTSLINATNIRFIAGHTAVVTTVDGELFEFVVDEPLYVDGEAVGVAAYDQGTVFIPIRYITLRMGLVVQTDPTTGAIYLVRP
jgi:serine/threonine protein kinase